jgi:hypothetical protein
MVLIDVIAYSEPLLISNIQLNEAYAAVRSVMNFTELHNYLTFLFSKGDLGWHWGMKLTNDKGDRLLQRAYHRFRLHQRSDHFLIEAIISAIHIWLMFGQPVTRIIYVGYVHISQILDLTFTVV